MEIEEEIDNVKRVRMEVDAQGGKGVPEIKVAGERIGEKVIEMQAEELQADLKAGLADQPRGAK